MARRRPIHVRMVGRLRPKFHWFSTRGCDCYLSLVSRYLRMLTKFNHKYCRPPVTVVLKYCWKIPHRKRYGIRQAEPECERFSQ